MYRFFNQQLLTTLGALALAWVMAPRASGQILDRVETVFEGIGPGLGGFNGIEGAFGVAMSPDDEHVYVVGTGPPGNVGGSIAVFSRNTDDQAVDFGKVTFVEALFDDEEGAEIDGIEGLRSARGVTVSPDGKHVYVVALSDDSVVVFSRNTTAGVDFGKLTYVETHEDNMSGVDGLGGAHGITISPDGEHIYIAARSETAGDDGVSVFSRDDSSGSLTFVEFHKNNVGLITGLKDCERLTLSPDGKHLYVASEGADSNSPGSVAVFSRNTDTLSVDFGKLTFVESHIDGINGADGLLNANDVAVSPDGKHVYVTNQVLLDESEDWLAIFSRDETTGALTFVSKLNANAADFCASAFENLGVASEVVVSPDGKSVVASSNWVGAVVSFSRNAVSGILTLADMVCDGVPGDDLSATAGIVTVNAVTMSADGQHVYTTGLGPPASLVFLTNSVGSVQPDGRIGKKPTSLLGNGVYNTTGGGQKINVVSKKLRTAKIHGRIENDGDIGDRIGLRGTKGNRHFNFTYLLNGANVTAAIGKGTLEELFSPSEQRKLLLKAKPSRKLKNKRNGRIKRKKRNITITARSKVDGAKTDVVKGIVKAK